MAQTVDLSYFLRECSAHSLNKSFDEDYDRNNLPRFILNLLRFCNDKVVIGDQRELDIIRRMFELCGEHPHRLQSDVPLVDPKRLEPLLRELFELRAAGEMGFEHAQHQDKQLNYMEVMHKHVSKRTQSLDQMQITSNRISDRRLARIRSQRTQSLTKIHHMGRMHLSDVKPARFSQSASIRVKQKLTPERLEKLRKIVLRSTPAVKESPENIKRIQFIDQYLSERYS
jgi:hypothetical protein